MNDIQKYVPGEQFCPRRGRKCFSRVKKHNQQHKATQGSTSFPVPEWHFAQPGEALAEAVGEHKLQPLQEEIHVREHFFSRQVLLRDLGFGVPGCSELC
ncbi:hypothetical protein EK904_000231 [Melospiza melodia maxima]|nr:hypothetical protein EK904_000231 [Melospiza melodia maxima]